MVRYHKKNLYSTEIFSITIMTIKGFLLKKDKYSAVKNILFCFFNFRKIIISIIKYVKSSHKIDKNLLNNKTLFITHSIGGGTGQFVRNYISENNLEESTVFLTNKLSKKTYLYELNNSSGFGILLFPFQIKKLLDVDFSNIYINSFFGFPDWKVFLKFIEDYKIKHPSCHIEYFVHDFHCVCPHMNLICKNEFCNLECNKNKCCFYKRVDFTSSIKNWRANWNIFLNKIDQIRCFSESSKKIIQQIYNEIPETQFTVIPHSMKFSKFTPVNNIENKPFKCAVIGFIDNAAKGVYVIEYLMNEFAKHNLQLTFIGIEESDINKYIIIQGNNKFLGKYNHDDLQNIIEKENISIVAFPSACPETFSYLVSELIQMNIPVIGLNIGAQAEKLKNYKKGIISESKEDMAEKLIDLAKINEEK